MSSDDQKFIEELTAWVGPEGETRDSRIALLASRDVVSASTVTAILKGRYNASPRLRTAVRSEMAMLDPKGTVSPRAAKAASAR
jgi:hypothetical protein